MLRTPDWRRHAQYIAVTPDAGDVIVHVAGAPAASSWSRSPRRRTFRLETVLAAAHRIGIEHATAVASSAVSWPTSPLGEGPLWLLREITAASDSCTAVLPAWSATSEHDLTDPSARLRGRQERARARRGPWQARQAAMARYSRTGFEAAAVTGCCRRGGGCGAARKREAQLRFAHPYAVVAVTTDPAAAASGPWHGLPVFSAWVSEPEDASLTAPRQAAAVSTAYLPSSGPASARRSPRGGRRNAGRTPLHRSVDQPEADPAVSPSPPPRRARRRGHALAPDGRLGLSGGFGCGSMVIAGATLAAQAAEACTGWCRACCQRSSSVW